LQKNKSKSSYRRAMAWRKVRTLKSSIADNIRRHATSVKGQVQQKVCTVRL